MKLKAVSGIVLTVLLVGMLTLAFDIQPVKASGFIYIKADGSIDPPTAPISTTDNITYTFTGNIYEQIYVERSNIIVDGNGFTLQYDGVGSRGFYLEYVSNVTIQSTNIKDWWEGIVLATSANYNNISGNTITNNFDGIWLVECLNNSISGNTITANNNTGIVLSFSADHNSISGNTITNNGHEETFGMGGVEIYDSFFNNVSGNTIINNRDGIILYAGSSNNTISGNTIRDNNSDGVYVRDSSFNTLSVNNITANYHGIKSDCSNHNNISMNNIANNSDCGVYLYDSCSFEAVSENKITNNTYGVRIHWGPSSNNTISGNTITNNDYGVILWNKYAYNTRLYHNNFLNNTQQAQVDFGVSPADHGNVWDDGYPSGGNYWDDYTGDDANGDGIGDTSYIIVSYPVPHIDHYPLMNPYVGARVTIKAHCNTEDVDVSVSIIMDGSPTGNTTPHTFTNLTGTHTFIVPNTDPNGHPFKQWNTGETSTIITVTTGGTYIAYYQAKYNLTITTTTGGTTNPPPGTHSYWEGTSVSVTAIPDADYVFDHWELDSAWNYSNPISVTMDSDHTLHAVFVPTYNVTIQAYCYTEGAYVSVSITMDGSPTGYNTPHTFTGLTGTHTFTVPNTDPQDHPFKQWSTSLTSTTITVTNSGTYTAYYGEAPPPPPVGGVWFPVDKLALLAPYIALASTILVATAATAIYVKHRKKKQ